MTERKELADELDRHLDAYLSSIDGGQNQIVNEVALRNALWDNKAGIIAYLRTRADAQGKTDCGAKEYVERAIASYAGDPASNQFQKGFLAALEVVRDEAFTAPPEVQSEIGRLREGLLFVQDWLGKPPNAYSLAALDVVFKKLRRKVGEALAVPSTQSEGGIHFPGRDPTAGEII